MSDDDLTEYQRLFREDVAKLAALTAIPHWYVTEIDIVLEEELLDYEASLEAPPEEWQPSTVDLNFLHDLRVGQLPDHGGWRYRYQQGSRLA